MDKEKLEKLSRPLRILYLSIEDEILLNIARKIARDNDLLVDIEENGDIQRIESWQMQRLNDLESLTLDNIRTIAKYADKTVEVISDTLSKAGYQAVDDIEGILREGAKRGILMAPTSSNARNSESLLNILRTMVNRAENDFNLINTTLLDQSRVVYLDIINRTTANVLTGNMTPQQALRRVSSEWAQKGVPALIDRAGRQWSTEAYVGMVTRTMSNNIANEMQDERMAEYGVDLVEISSHDGARPLCAPYQGRIFSLSGNHPDYPPLSSTSIGEPAGLFGVNCGHVKYPYIPGLTKRSFKPVSQRRNEKIYEESQKQRYLERRIREAKREKAFMEALNDEEGVKIAQRKISDRQANMRSFINQTNRTRRYNREQIG